VGEAGGLVRQRTDVAIEGRPAFVEELAVGGGIDVPGLIGANRVLDSVLTVGLRGVAPPPTVAVLELEATGSLARYLGMSTHMSPLDAVWESWSRRLRPQTGDADRRDEALYQAAPA
jgi:urease accessory protein